MFLFPCQQIFDIHPVLGKHLVPGVTNTGYKNVENNKYEPNTTKDFNKLWLCQAQKKLKPQPKNKNIIFHKNTSKQYQSNQIMIR